MSANDESLMETWSEIRAWRRAMRAELLARRLAVPKAERQRIGSLLRDRLKTQFPELRHACVGFYWPFKGEIDVRDVIGDFLALGAKAALPVVVKERQPLEFWAWHPHMKLRRGLWDIPVPAEPNPVQPTVLLAPLLGFDMAGYRLGYGGGYYDRTLAAMNPKPLTIGVGYELGRLPTIHPQPHDQPLDAIMTEAETVRFRDGGVPVGRAAFDARLDEKLDEALKATFPASDPFQLSPAEEERPEAATERTGRDVACASPPCFMPEIGAAYLGYLGSDETISLLNLLLEGERAGARAAAEMGRQATMDSNRPPCMTLQRIRSDSPPCLRATSLVSAERRARGQVHSTTS